MFTEDKITEIYCIADDFLKLFNDQMKKHAITARNNSGKRKISQRINDARDRSYDDNDSFSCIRISLSQTLLSSICMCKSASFISGAGIV